MKSYLIKIQGDVVHKGFRFGAMQMAYKWNIRGYAEYRRDKTVEIVAEGDEENLDAFLDWCRTGPVWAKVVEVSYEEREWKGYTSFDINNPKRRERS
jgi:acylphosphatase